MSSCPTPLLSDLPPAPDPDLSMLSLLVQLAVLAAIIAVFLVPYLIAFALGLPQPWPIVAAAATMGLGFFVLWRSMSRRIDSVARIRSTSRHKLLGEVRHRLDSWEASFRFDGGSGPIEVSGDQPEPTPGQLETFATIRTRWNEFVSRARKAVVEELDERAAATSGAIEPSSVLRSSDDRPGAFTLCFTLTNDENSEPWYVDHENFEITEVMEVH